jgi:membrane protease YdiL (CAAX protease family)
VSSLITSLLFALIHAPQLGYTWAAVALLVCVSVVLCVVRIRTGSVAASTVVHGCYNLSVFLSLFVTTGGFRHLDRV